jgi:hypothetical protein
MTQTKQYAVISRHGFSGNVTQVSSAHATEKAAIAAAKRSRYTDERGQIRTPLMVVRMEGATKGQTVYMDTVPRIYPVIW